MPGLRVLAVVPARGGSKSVVRKNIATMAGKPLIAYTIEEAKKVSEICDLVVSTDDEEIAAVSQSLGALVPFIRPAHLAADDSQSAPVIEHCLRFMESMRKCTYDAVLMLQPTTPLRKSDHIERAIKMLETNDCESVVSVVSVAGYHPFRMKRFVDNRLLNFIEQGFEDMRPRQLLPPVYIRNGAIYLTRRNVIIDRGWLVGEPCVGFEMEAHESVNIDTRDDLLFAEFILLGKCSP